MAQKERNGNPNVSRRGDRGITKSESKTQDQIRGTWDGQGGLAITMAKKNERYPRGSGWLHHLSHSGVFESRTGRRSTRTRIASGQKHGARTSRSREEGLGSAKGRREKPGRAEGGKGGRVGLRRDIVHSVGGHG